MLRTLTQIIATFWAIGATFIAAYLVYLYSSSTNIEEKIHMEGLEIFNVLRSAPTYKNSFGSTILEASLLKQYKAKYPDKSRVYIYERIASDLFVASAFDDDESRDMLSAGEWGKPHGHIVGRTFFWIIEKSVDHLVPEEVYWSGRRHTGTLSLPPDTTQAALFPVGPIAVEQWVHDSKIIVNYLKFLFPLKEKLFIPDLEQFIEKSEDGAKKLYKNDDYANWLSEMERAISLIDIHNSRVNSLLLLKESYSIEKRLPNLKWILFLGIGAFIAGIILPLILLAFHNEFIPTTVNLVIGACALTFLIGGIFLIGKDVMSYHRNEYHIKYFEPFKKQLINYNARNELIVFDVTLANKIIQLIENKVIKQPKDFTKILKEYRNAINVSNSCSERSVDILSDEIRRSIVLKSYSAEPLAGGRSINILSPLWPETRKSLLEALSKLDANFIIQADYEGMTIDIFKIKTPGTKERSNELISEINRIYNEFSNLQELQSCMAKRENLEKLRNTLIGMLE